MEYPNNLPLLPMSNLMQVVRESNRAPAASELKWECDADVIRHYLEFYENVKNEVSGFEVFFSMCMKYLMQISPTSFNKNKDLEGKVLIERWKHNNKFCYKVIHFTDVDNNKYILPFNFKLSILHTKKGGRNKYILKKVGNGGRMRVTKSKFLHNLIPIWELEKAKGGIPLIYRIVNGESMEFDLTRYTVIPEYNKKKRKLIRSLIHIDYTNQNLNQNRKRPVDQFTADGVFIKTYACMSEATIATKISSASICQVCRGDQSIAGGYVWKYNNLELEIRKDPLDKLILGDNLSDIELLNDQLFDADLLDKNLFSEELFYGALFGITNNGSNVNIYI